MEDQWEPGALLQKEGGAQPVFALDDSDLGCRDLAKHNIDIHRRASIQASSKYLFKKFQNFLKRLGRNKDVIHEHKASLSKLSS